MNITLETAREVFRRTFGPDSFVATFVARVIPDPSVPTACINAAGELRYGPRFVEQHVRTDVDLFCLLCHELLHPAFGHFIHPDDGIANTACDAVINAIITHVFAEPSGHGSLFLRIYPERGLPGLLRSGSAMSQSRYQSLYSHLYPTSGFSCSLSAGEIIQSLRVLAPGTAPDVLLIGSHGKRHSRANGVDGWSSAVAARVTDDLLRVVREAGTGAGRCPHLQDLLIEVLKRNESIRESLLSRYASRRLLGNFLGENQRMRRVTSPFPIRPSRRDLVMLSAGAWPGLFRNQQPEIRHEQKGVAIFLDVSGSVNEHLPEIIGLLSRHRDRIRSVHLFSNAVREVPFDVLCAGRLSTTYGTDFNCVASTVVEKEYDRAVVLTDGYASLDDEHSRKLSEIHPAILTILFGTKADCPDLAPFGEVVQLADVTE
ncbi:MAG: hypothetical protein HN742_11190 [Lentisphaerae bacterium]|jgi:hypothetical protein|nr:hypothetical protein [Lentisphaerota bacterium]MBT4822159.1 hypothetical protein [Lentisphaerota bacterium]MBT5610518.1 hypothetical protein [Lentisphaerota bacterium]MBT7056073.1 hypothetical protein [Lentisphaerota bacterium]MBT7842430.1 hypothetical protein [Lentisphaerota bacterium]